MGKPRKREGGESTSSIYVTDDEEEAQIMEVVVNCERLDNRKRNRSEGNGNSGGSEGSAAEPTKIRKNEAQETELQRMENVMKVLQKKMQDTKEQEERERRAVAEQTKIREKQERKEQERKEQERKKTEGIGKADKIERIQSCTRKIMEAIERETAGKISVRREDQNTVSKAVFEIQDEVLDLIKMVIRAEEKAKEMEEKLKRNEERMKEMSERSRMEGGNERRSERGLIREMNQTRRVMSGDSSSEEWQERGVRKRKGRTYAEVMKGSESERIEGRVVVPGKEGWKTPPTKSTAGERPLVVTSKEEKDARKLADSLARNVTVQDMGGAPRAVRKIRDGKLVIVPKDGQHKEKMAEALKKVRGVEESKQMEPLLLVTGVVKGLSDTDLIEQIKRGMSVRLNEDEIRIVRRQACRNNWKENVVVRMNVDGFKELVKKGKIDIDCTLCYVEEYLGLAMCYRCCRFGHTSRVCREPEACHRCGGSHQGKDCVENRRRCVNCIRMFGRSSEHTARDGGCPAMRDILARSRGNISYGR